MRSIVDAISIGMMKKRYWDVLVKSIPLVTVILPEKETVIRNKTQKMKSVGVRMCTTCS
jgi:tRNA A37 threonylcarbamoyladenosine synthetase subunit TsaC/SUA5/YrdC